MSERDGELAARGAPRAAPEPVAAATGQAVARTRLTAQMVLGLLFILGFVGLLYWGREALPPFFLGLIVAYMLLPLVRRVEHTLPAWRNLANDSSPHRRGDRLPLARCCSWRSCCAGWRSR